MRFFLCVPMTEPVKLSHLRDVLDSIEYPISKSDARDETAGIVLQYADGEERLSAVISRANDDTFEGVDDLEAEIYGNLPIEAVGEPGQSEGDS